MWKFSVYLSNSGKNDVQDEIDAYHAYDRQSFERAVRHLAASPIWQWNKPKARKLSGQDPLYEICYKASNRQTRALGYFQKDSEEFVITLLCYHKGRVYEPPDAFATAHRRIKEIANGTASTVSLKISGENFPTDEE